MVLSVREGSVKNYSANSVGTLGTLGMSSDMLNLLAATAFNRSSFLSLTQVQTDNSPFVDGGAGITM
jgi:hypothetical protein